MKTRIGLVARCAFLLMVASVGCRTQDLPFPHWRPYSMPLGNVWTMSEVVAVGNVTNIAKMGRQDWNQGVPPGIRAVFKQLQWCEADFVLTEVVKGSFPRAHGKYVWGKIEWGNAASECVAYGMPPPRPATPTYLIWFLREEGNLLRPVSDRSRFYFEVPGEWNTQDSLPPAQKAGLALLKELSEDTKDPGFIGFLGDAACELLGREQCIKRMRDPAGSETFRRQACAYLEAQGRVTCTGLGVHRWGS